jgi:hypothetical protein
MYKQESEKYRQEFEKLEKALRKKEVENSKDVPEHLLPN